MKPTDVTALSNDLLKACVDAYSNMDVTGDPPTRRFVTHGQNPPADMEQLVVACAGLRPVRPWPGTDVGKQAHVVVPAADLTVWLWRECWPAAEVHAQTIMVPGQNPISEAAARLAQDASTIFGYVSALAVANLLFPSVPGLCKGDITISPMTPLEPSGKLAGWRWPLSVKLAIR